MVKHIVMWKFKPGAPLGEIRSRLEAMVPQIPLIRSLEVGTDFLRSPRSWDMVLVTAFQTRADLDAYAVHPDHVPVADFIGQWKDAGAVVDYEI